MLCGICFNYLFSCSLIEFVFTFRRMLWGELPFLGRGWSEPGCAGERSGSTEHVRAEGSQKIEGAEASFDTSSSRAAGFLFSEGFLLLLFSLCEIKAKYVCEDNIHSVLDVLCLGLESSKLNLRASLIRGRLTLQQRLCRLCNSQSYSFQIALALTVLKLFAPTIATSSRASSTAPSRPVLLAWLCLVFC